MHMQFAHLAVWRGLVFFAAAIKIRGQQSEPLEESLPQTTRLVSWCAGASTRREDELARMRQGDSR